MRGLTGLIIAGAVLLVLIGIGLLRVGGGARYSANGAEVWLKIGPKRIAVYPPPRKERKPKKQKAPKEPRTEKKGGPVEGLLKSLDLVFDMLGKFLKTLRVDFLEFTFIAAAHEDPTAAALLYGGANAAAGMILPVLEHNFNIRRREVKILCDYGAERIAVFAAAQLSLRVWQILYIGGRFFLKYFTRLREQKNKKEKVTEYGR